MVSIQQLMKNFIFPESKETHTLNLTAYEEMNAYPYHDNLEADLHPFKPSDETQPQATS